MRILIGLALALGLAACEQSGAPSEGFKPKTTEAFAAATGARYSMYSVVGIGDIVIGESTLTTSDGQELPIEKVADGVWFFQSQPSELTNGENFCFSKPVTFFTWHKHDEGLWVMNVGDWRSPPAVPAADQWQAEGACGLSTYQPAEA